MCVTDHLSVCIYNVILSCVTTDGGLKIQHGAIDMHINA